MALSEEKKDNFLKGLSEETRSIRKHKDRVAFEIWSRKKLIQLSQQYIEEMENSFSDSPEYKDIQLFVSGLKRIVNDLAEELLKAPVQHKVEQFDITKLPAVLN